MDRVAQGRMIIEVLERCYRQAEEDDHRPERGTGDDPEPTSVDAQAAERATAELITLGVLPDAGWEGWLRISWFPYLRRFPGYDRRIGPGWAPSDRLVRFPLDGDTGRAYATFRFDADGQLVGMMEGTRERNEGDPPESVTFACPPERRSELKAFYQRLLGRDLPCGEARGGYLPPRWPDPKYPQQLHLDLLVADLDAAEAVVLGLGGRRLQDQGDFRTYADPLGHPVCIYRDTTGRAEAAPGAAPGRLARIVLDCPDPGALADFYGSLLRMPERVEDAADRIVIARAADTLPMLAFQRVADYLAPSWPDPAYPAQVHFDLAFDDRAAAERKAVELGATWLRPQHEDAFGHVYADPAGHPFCLLEPGE